MPVASVTRLALIAACQARLQAQGHLLDGSQLIALVDDIEFQINANSGTVLADVTSDLGIFSDPPLGGL